MRRARTFKMDVRRRREIEAIARALEVGSTDDLDTFLVAWVWHNKDSRDRTGAVVEAARRMGRTGMTIDEAARIVEEADATPEQRGADSLARFLGLRFEMRQALAVTTIGATDVPKREREKRRKELKRYRDRVAKAVKRRQAGAVVREEYERDSISDRKPWEAEGVSRSTWYRNRKRADLRKAA